MTSTVTPRADGSVQVETVTVKVDGGVDGTSLDETVNEGAPPEGDGGLLTGVRFCCPAPVTRDDGTATTLGTVRAWVDASGHPGFHRPEATRIDGDGSGFSAVAVPAPGDGTVTLDPCTIAPAFGCGALPEGHTAQWLFGDGAVTARLDGTLAAQTHRYPRTPGNDAFLGILVHYDENHEVVDKAYFTLAP